MTYSASSSRPMTKAQFGLVHRCLLILAAVLIVGCSENVQLQTGLADADANEMAMVLNRSGIEFEKRRDKEGVSLYVDVQDLSRASAAMTAAGLPRRELSSLGQIFKKQGMISSPLEERIRYIHGLSEELGYTLQKFDRVISARVHVVLPERVAPGEPILPSSAAVFVKYLPPLDEDATIPHIRNLVSSSIPGLIGDDGPSKVSVVMLPTEIKAPEIAWTRIGPFKVQAESATYLVLLLWTLLILTLLVAGLVIAQLSKKDERLAALLKTIGVRVTALMPSRRGSTD